FLAGFAQAIAEGRNRVVEGFGVVRPVLEHDEVGSELVEVAAPAAAAHVGLDPRLEKRVQRRALLGRDRGDTGHVRVSEVRRGGGDRRLHRYASTATCARTDIS